MSQKNFQYYVYFACLLLLFILFFIEKTKLTRKLPNVLIIGASICDTNSLLDIIATHPNVAACRKEINFFNQNENYEKGFEWYRSQMPYSNDKQITLEKTFNYLTSELAPKRVHAFNPQIKQIVVYCDKHGKNATIMDLKAWFIYFRKENYLLIDGEQFKKSPSITFDHLQSFLNLKKWIGQRNFVYNNATDSHCLIHPVSSRVRCF
jgi:hypothetical protein